MTICKYFLQGTCRFGDRCKFDHQVTTGDHNYTNSTSILLHNYANKPAQGTSNVDTNTLIKSVVNDMTSAEKGGQWLLSSYAPFKEKPAFPGFEDHSMEEIRYLFYESMRNGTLEQYKQNLQLMLQQAVMKIKALQNPSPDAINMLKSIYNTTPSSSFGNSQTPFNPVSTGNSMFGGSQQNSMFGGQNTNQNIFETSNTSTTIFGANKPTQQSVFGSSNSNSVFRGNATSTSVFGGQSQTSPNKSIFGGSQQTSNNSVFGGSSVFGGVASIFGNQPQPTLPFTQSSPFGQQPTQQQMTFTAPQQNVFQQNTNSQFGTMQNPSNLFGASQQTNQYGGCQSSSHSTFGSSQQTVIPANKPSFQHTANIFGNIGMQTQNTNGFGATGNQMKPNEEFYSKLEELSEEEIEWFQSDDLDISKIPEKPPTYEMCFKI